MESMVFDELTQLASGLPQPMATRLEGLFARLATGAAPADIEKLERFRTAIMGRARAEDDRLVEVLELAAARLRGFERLPRGVIHAIAAISAHRLASSLEKTPPRLARETLRAAAECRGLAPEQAVHLLHPELPLEVLLEAAGRIGWQSFGGRVVLYTPLYLSNECVNNCAYCGFQMDHGKIIRRTLSVDEVLAEARLLHQRGFRHLLLVAAENPLAVSIPYLRAVLERLAADWPAIDVEIGPLSVDGYAALHELGVGGVTIYQETYERKAFKMVHRRGLKNRYEFRLETPERAIDGGCRRIGIGVLLGLAEPIPELLWLIGHARYLEARYPAVRLSVSLPRLRPEVTGFSASYPVDDPLFLRLAAIVRLALPQAELVVSTRETAAMRDRLLRAGATRLSAGSCTQPGGYSLDGEAGEQFEIADHRSVEEVAEAIRAAGCEPFWLSKPGLGSAMSGSSLPLPAR